MPKGYKGPTIKHPDEGAKVDDKPTLPKGYRPKKFEAGETKFQEDLEFNKVSWYQPNENEKGEEYLKKYKEKPKRSFLDIILGRNKRKF